MRHTLSETALEKSHIFNMLVLLIFLIMLIGPTGVIAADIFVSPSGAGDGSIGNPTDLQDALDTARTNGEDDTVYLRTGTYDASASTYTYDATANDNMAVTLSGGWNSGYTLQSTDPSLTMLDGGGTNRVLEILADATGVDYTITFHTLTIQNGYVATGNVGGGIRAYVGGDPVTSGSIDLFLNNCLFKDNVAGDVTGGAGGAMYTNCYFEATDCTFSSNSAGSGGAMYILYAPGPDYSLAPVIDNCSFDDNKSLSWQGSTIFSYASPVISSCFFTGRSDGVSSSGPGSTIYCQKNSTLTLSESVFENNQTDNWGSAIEFWDTNGLVINCMFLNNTAGVGGSGNAAVDVFSATTPHDEIVTFINCTFSGNSGDGSTSGAIYNRYATVNVSNSIFWDNNGTAGLYKASGTASVEYSIVQNSAYGGFVDAGNNKTDDPQFVGTGNYRIQSTSPCVDAGDDSAVPVGTTTDFEGGPRFVDGDNNGSATVDMGADEYTPVQAAPGLYVVPGGAGLGTKNSPTNLQSALDTARADGYTNTIYLQTGTYDASASTFTYGTTDNDNLSVTLSGGWNSGYTSQSTDPSLTLLDGGGTNRVLEILADALGVTITFTLKNLTIQNGYVATGNVGAGIRAYVGSTPASSGSIDLFLNNCLFQNNVAGDATGGAGGAMYTNCYFEATNCTFSSNWAGSGGAMYIIYAPGPDYSLAPVIDNCSFDDNQSLNWQGSTIFSYASPVISSCTFTGRSDGVSSSGPGSTIYCQKNSTLTLSDSIFENNVTTYWGSAIEFWDTDGLVINCMFLNNQAGVGGSGNAAVDVFSEFSPHDEIVTFINCTFSGNSGDGATSGAIYNRTATVNVINSIFWDNNGTAGLYKASGTASVEYSIVQNSAYGGFADGGNNKTDDPQFVGSGDYHIQGTSPCVDAGRDSAVPAGTTTDFEGSPRIVDGDGDGTPTVDMGADEHFMPARIAAEPNTYYPSIQAACNAAVNDDIIECVAGQWLEDLDLQNVNVTFDCGMDSTFSTYEGLSIIEGSFTITSGSAVISNFGIASP